MVAGTSSSLYVRCIIAQRNEVKKSAGCLVLTRGNRQTDFHRIYGVQTDCYQPVGRKYTVPSQLLIDISRERGISSHTLPHHCETSMWEWMGCFNISSIECTLDVYLEIIFFQHVTMRVIARMSHFCSPLAVTRKFRLCLQPRGLLRVQSLHLPIWAWLGVFCRNKYTRKFI